MMKDYNKLTAQNMTMQFVNGKIFFMLVLLEMTGLINYMVKDYKLTMN